MIAPRFVDVGQHDETRPRIVLAVHPRNGQKMRHLPAEQDRKERPRLLVDRPARRRPADHRRQRPRDRADEGVEVVRRLSGVYANR